MALPDIAKNMILEAGGQEMLNRALAADSKAADDTKKLDALGIASKNYDQYGDAPLVISAEQSKVITEAQTAMETRLKAAETLVEAVKDYPATIKSLQDMIKTLSDELEAAKTREAAALESMKTMQEKLALLTDLKPPASQSQETLLNDREKTLIDSMMSAAKAADQPSLVDSIIGGSPAISTVNGG